MGDYRDKLAKKADGVLRPGEQLLAGARLVRGLISLSTGVALGGVIGGMIADRKGSKADGPEGSLANSLNLPKQVAIGLTDQRLIFWNRGLLTGGAKNVIGELTLEQLTSVGYESGSLMGKVALTLADGSTLGFDAPRMEKSSAARIAEEWSRLTGGAPAEARAV